MGFFSDMLGGDSSEDGSLENIPDTSYLSDGSYDFPDLQKVKGLYLNERSGEVESALKRSANIWNVEPSAFALGSDFDEPNSKVTPTYQFSDTLSPHVGAQTEFTSITNGRPIIKLRRQEPIDPGHFEHEGVHRLSPHFRKLKEDGGVRDFNAVTDNGLSGYPIAAGGADLYMPDYKRFDNYEDRSQFFINQFANDAANQQRPALKKYMGGAVGRVLADDLLHIDSGPTGPLSSSESYSRDPEEILARAVSTYGVMKDLPEDVRFNATGAEYYKRRLPTAQEIKDLNLLPSDKIGFRHINEPLNGHPRIRPETYEAIKLWMENNKMNKYGNGFTMNNSRGPLSV